MKLSTLSSLFVLLSVVSLIAIAPSAFAANHEVTITNAPGSSTPGCEETNTCFIPNPVTVEIGTIVTWSNTDTAAHTASSGTAAGGDMGEVWNSSLIMAGGSYSYTTDTVGSFDYFCMVHPWMAGTLIVEEVGAAEAAAADAAAEAEAADAAAADAAAAEAADAAAEAADAAAAAMAAAEAAAAAMAAEAADAAAADAAAADAAADAAAADAAAEAAMAAPAIDAADYISTSGAPVTSITANADDDSVIIAIDAADDGVLSVTLHSEVITAFDDGTYFVLIDNEEVEFEQSGSNLTIPYEAGNERVEIVGSHVVPEFGTIAMIILAVALVSIIVITAKTRTTLIPKL
jgi:predicted secreted protein with PEFG-CTERM motif